MRTIIIICFLLFLRSQSYSQSQWILRNPLTADSIKASCITSPNNIIVTGNNNLILKSSDRGNNWTKIQFSGSGESFRYIKFLDPNTGFIASRYLYKTTNGGDNWIKMSENAFADFCIISTQIGYASSFENGKRKLYKTTNGGTTWGFLDSLNSEVSKYFFVDNALAFSIRNNKLLKSTDEGHSWNVCFTSVDSVILKDAIFKDYNLGFITSGHYLYKTTDGGNNWIQQQYYFSYSFNEIYLGNGNFVFTSISVTPNGAVLAAYSSNNGQSWSIGNSGLSSYSSVTSFAVYDQTNIVYTYGINSIYKSSDLLTNVTLCNPNSINENLLDVQMLTREEAIMTSGGSFLYRTGNRGVTWTKDTINKNLKEFDFINESTGFATDGAKIYKTTDMGFNWDSINRPATNSYSYSASNIKFLNEQTGFLKFYYSQGWGSGANLYTSIQKTSNGGQNWQIVASLFGSVNSQGNNSYGDFSKVNFVNQQTGFFLQNYISTRFGTIVSINSFISKTTDGGSHWFKIWNNDSTNLADISFINDSTGYFSISRSIDTGSLSSGIFKTGNSGTNWQKVNNTSYSPLIFFDESIGYTNGYSTSNGGVSWNFQFTPFTCNSINFLKNTGAAMAVGNSGIIYYTSDGGGLLSAGSSQTYVPREFLLKQNYPNPFNPSTRINYELKITNYVTLKVFDLLGKEVASLVNEKQNAGSYAVDFNSAEYNLPSGIYFYTLTAGEFKETRKMVLVK